MPTIAQTIEKVDSFAKLQIGWHFGEGAPLTERLRKKAIEFLRYAEISGIARANAFPGVAGQIQVTFYYEDSMLELNIEGDGTVTIAEDEKQEQVYFKENASETDARTKLTEFSEKVWNFSELFIESITIPNEAIFQARHFSPQAIKASQSSKEIALFTPAVRSASTLRDFIRIKSETLPYTGKSPTTKYRKVAGSSSRRAQRVMIATSTSTVGAGIRRGKHSLLYS